MLPSGLRTTITLDPDATAAIEQLRKQSGQGISETVNRLIRRGLDARAAGGSQVALMLVDAHILLYALDLYALDERSPYLANG